jgi:hypothetical protein
MDMSLVTAAPLGLGVLIALGGILVMMSYLRMTSVIGLSSTHG